MTEDTLLVARGDVTVHRVLSMGTDLNGGQVEITEGVNLNAGDAVEPDALASYQQAALEDPELDGGHLSGQFAKMSSKEHAQLTASRDQAVRTVTNEATKAESDATVSKVAAAGPNATEGAIEYANEKGIDLNQVEGTGAEGRITKNDVLEHEEKGGDANGG